MKATQSDPGTATFDELGLSAPVLEALKSVGYESPSPIQSATIPVLLAGHDMLGQAQTGTGKTAAFALPLLSGIKVRSGPPQVIVLVPTRELAIQVAEAFQRYAAKIKGFHVLPIYGGQSYTPQLMSLKRGAHVVVGTPGRVMDHIKRGTLDLGGVACLVLDEADEMLQMGFVDDIEWILEQTPPGRQVALFSATLPSPIRRIAQKDQHRGQYPPALLGRKRRAQARRADAHPGGRGFRGHADLHPHQAVHGRTGREAGGARLRGRAAERRHAAEGARAHRHAPEGRPARHPGGDRRRGARP
jgi:superfamily II DNA/RNA helicase